MPIFNSVYKAPDLSHFATQGPCPDGFHVPTQNEWSFLVSYGKTLGAWTASGGNNFRTYLKMPFPGFRNTTSGVYSQNSRGYYWSSSSKNETYAWGTGMSASSLSDTTSLIKGYGYSIRPFKNTPVIPLNGWTRLYNGGTGTLKGIFHNSTLGLISISVSGSTVESTDRITISDKNLGATTVYNSGDAVSEANCGKYYQWGNNYGFNFTGSVTTSSTLVDASNYGPGNYYTSSTFITTSASPYNRDSSNNGNLRGGEDGNVPM